MQYLLKSWKQNMFLVNLKYSGHNLNNSALLMTTISACKARLLDIAHTYCGTPIDTKDFSMTREHMIALSNLKKNKSVVVCKLDKGRGVLILEKQDYQNKMKEILGDTTKFTALGTVEKFDGTPAIENNL